MGDLPVLLPILVLVSHEDSPTDIFVWFGDFSYFFVMRLSFPFVKQTSARQILIGSFGFYSSSSIRKKKSSSNL